MDKVFIVKSCNGCVFKDSDEQVLSSPWCGHPDAPEDNDGQAPLIPKYDNYGDYNPDKSKTPLPDWCPLKTSSITISLKTTNE